MTLHLAFQDAMAEALLEYRDAKEDVIGTMKNGDIDGPAWRVKQDRLARSWLPRQLGS